PLLWFQFVHVALLTWSALISGGTWAWRCRRSVLGLLQGSAAIVAAAALASCHTAGPSREAAVIDAGDLHRVATMDERYQSYNIEMLEVTGGRFWKPYSAISSSDAPKGAAAESSGGGATPAG